MTYILLTPENADTVRGTYYYQGESSILIPVPIIPIEVESVSYPFCLPSGVLNNQAFAIHFDLLLSLPQVGSVEYPEPPEEEE